MRVRVLVVAAAVLTALSTVDVLAQSEAPAADNVPQALIGTWRLNVAKSKYSPGPPMRDETRVYTRGPEGVTGVVTRTYADGHVERYQYTANFGGEYAVTGNPEYDAVRLRRIDEYSSEAVLSHAGTIYGIARRAIASDGRTMTITFDRKDADRPVHNLAVYDKQP